ncbi:MAG: divalent metal cation transporter [Akkermansiaceae bacterium]|nr:divalent metal cation transporter [Akkermansiaceae bacterium]
MADSDANLERQRQRLREAAARGPTATALAFLRLSGPGWLQSAVTLGGGSLAGSLYLGIIGGYEMMWLQPLMMLFGIVMLSAIAHVTLSTGEAPFRALNRRVNPVLGWAWIVATLMANLVWAMPQFSLGGAALRQNLGILPGEDNKALVALCLAAVSGLIVWLYDSSARGYRIFDLLLKGMVAVVVLSFFGVVAILSLGPAGLPWGEIAAGFLPRPGLIFEPAESLRGPIAASSDPEYWHRTVVSAQRDRMVAAAATAVGINMTFLLPYSMRKRGWDRDFRGLARFDLATGLFVPFVLATSCVVIAAAAQFHGKPEPGLIEGRTSAGVPAKLRVEYEANLSALLVSNGEACDPEKFATLPEADRVLAATLIQRDAFALADSLKALAGEGWSQTVFGIGVVGMAVSSIVILMLINGFTVCEMFGRPSRGWLYRVGALLPAVSGVFGALYLWSGKAQFYLAVPTSRFGMVLLPIAYIGFFFLMNHRRLLGDAMPAGGRRVAWNVLMTIAIALSLTGAAISILNDTAVLPGTGIAVRHLATGLAGMLAGGALLVFFLRKRRANPPASP